MKIKDIKDFSYELISGNDDVELKSISYDTRKISEDDIFVCISGSNFDSHDLISDIISKKAKLIVVEKDIDIELYKNINIIKVNNSRIALAILSANLFSNPAKNMTIIGVTGTKGKTSTTHMIKKILEKAGKKVGMIGTNGIYISDEYIESKNTTPESYELHSIFKKMYEKSCEYVVMEVSSQAVKLDRIYGIDFDYGIFTNISPDHIGPNEHKDFEEYLECKTRFFDQCNIALINIDDENSNYVLENSNARAKFTFGSSKKADFYFDKLKYVNKNNFVGIEFILRGIKVTKVKLGMPGLFNAYNALAAIAVAIFLKINDNILEESLEDIRIDGRMEIVFSNKDFSVMVDYAHNAYSLENLLNTLKNYKAKRLVVLFGCGGNRSKDRRYGMGEVAAKLADYIIVTADNSRFEKIEDITNDIISKIKNTTTNYICIYDRREAIQYAIEHAKKGDIIAIIGKGHENYQEIEGIRHYFKDSEEIIKAIEIAKKKGFIDA